MQRPLAYRIQLSIIVICTSLIIAVGAISSGTSASPASNRDAQYTPSRAPLKPDLLLELPPGAITTHGWLKDQLENEKTGMTGQLASISPFLKYEGNGWVDKEANTGWEELGYWLRGYGDLGYVLHDKTVISETEKWINGILADQRADGWFGPHPLRTALNGMPDMWPHMLLLTVLQHNYEYTRDQRVLSFMKRYFAFQMHVKDADFNQGWGATRWGDEIETLLWYYNTTGDKLALHLISKIHANSANWLDNLPTLHNVNLSQGFREPAEYGQLNTDPIYERASEIDYHLIKDQYGQFPGGGFAGDEVVRPEDTDPRQGFETCGIVELMHSCEMMERLTGSATWADRTEDLAFNSLPAALTADQDGLHYITAANSIALPVGGRTDGQFNNNGMPMQFYAPACYGYRCCIHNYGMGWPFYAENTWLATSSGGLCASMYAATTVTVKVAAGVPVRIVEATRYPFRDMVDLHLYPSRSVVFPLMLRIPRWCSNPEVVVDGHSVKIGTGGDCFITLTRKWKKDDRVVLQLPMKISVRRWSANKSSASINYGPLTFSLLIGEQWNDVGGTKLWPRFSVMPTTPWNYGLVLNASNPVSGMHITVRPLIVGTNPFTREDAPLELTVQGQLVPSWTSDSQDVVKPLVPSPAAGAGPVVNLTLIPMGAARLRITAFPVIGTDASTEQVSLH